MTAGKKKEGGSMLMVLRTETEKSMFGQVAAGHGVILLGSHGRQGWTCVSTYQQYLSYTVPNVGMVLLT